MRLARVAEVGLCLLPVLAGSWLAASAWQHRTVRDVHVGKVALRLERAGWLHTEGHDSSLPMPGMAQLPAQGRHRLSVEVSLHNLGAEAVDFPASELGLYLAEGVRLDEPREEVVSVPARHTLSSVLELEVAETPQPLQLRWQRGGQSRRLMTLSTPITPRSQVPSEEAWPAKAELLPPADPRAGAALFSGPLGCVACHGPLERPAEAAVGPSLAGLTQRISQRGLTIPPAQYAYESLLQPNAYVVGACPHGRPCAVPSVMPAYGERLSPQQMADLISFLVAPSQSAQE
ncbi:MAG: c-type cytochrome [Myxococcota bacterium]|nr:c-type cytochrome [Myxococcota bacterium]